MSKNPINKARASYYALFDKMVAIEQKVENLQKSVGAIESRQLRSEGKPKKIQDREFQVFSQWGEDGILDYLTDIVPLNECSFVEFGVEDYTESNTRYLLENKNWQGLVLDGSQENIKRITSSSYYWRHNLKALKAFVTKDNINDLIAGQGLRGEIGLLSIDIDGNDFWVWKSITVVKPAIVSVEYNSRLGNSKKLTIPYNKSFSRDKAHYSWLFYGASLPALCQLAKEKGYSFVGCNSAGVNAFFVRNDLLPKELKALSAKQGFVRGAFRESRTKDGQMSYLSPEEEEKLIASLPFIDPYEKK